MHFGAYTYHDSLKCRCTQGLKHGRCCSTPHLDLTYTSLRPHRNCQLNCLFYFLWRWEVYGRCMVPLWYLFHSTSRGSEAFVQRQCGRRREVSAFFCVSSPKNVYATRAKFPRHKHQVCPREASCSHGGRAPLPCHKMLSSLPQTTLLR